MRLNPIHSTLLQKPPELQEGVDASQACPWGRSSHSLFYNVIWALYYPLWRNTSKDRKVSDTKGPRALQLPTSGTVKYRELKEEQDHRKEDS